MADAREMTQLDESPDGRLARPTSEAEEMYLITIAMAVEEGHAGPVPVPHLAETMAVSRVSANEMVKKLAGRGLIGYEPYRGVTLTDTGAAIARSVLRHRRLWALFLSEHLGLSPAVADAAACEFEHVTPRDVAQRLSKFLGDPTVGPQGKPIPSAEDSTEVRYPELTVSEMTVGSRARIVRTTGDAAVRSFLHHEGVDEGAVVKLVAIGADGDCLLETDRGRVHLGSLVAEAVTVTPVNA